MLRARLISGVILLALVLLIAWARGPLLVAGVTAAAVLAVLELCAMGRAGGLRPVTGAALLLTLALLAPAAAFALAPLVANLPGTRGAGEMWLNAVEANPGLIDLLGMGTVLLSLPLLVLWVSTRDGGQERRPAAWRDAGITLGAALYAGGLLRYALLLDRPPGEGWWIVLVILGTAAADTGAYFAGRRFGKRKMIPHISPGKTWAGFWGGQIACILVVGLLAYLMSIPWWHVAPLGLAIGLASVAGDLAESMLKRGFGVKDSGSWIPGHGGLLDRLDSILFVLVVVYFYAVFFYS